MIPDRLDAHRLCLLPSPDPRSTWQAGLRPVLSCPGWSFMSIIIYSTIVQIWRNQLSINNSRIVHPYRTPSSRGKLDPLFGVRLGPKVFYVERE